MYKIVFINRAGDMVTTYVDTTCEYTARKAVAARKDFDAIVSCVAWSADL